MNNWQNPLFNGSPMDNYLAHGWGTSAKAKKREKEYNHWYYEQHKKLKGAVTGAIDKTKAAVNRLYQVSENEFIKDPTEKNSIMDYVGFGLIGGTLVQKNREKRRIKLEEMERLYKENKKKSDEQSEAYKQYQKEQEKKYQQLSEQQKKELEADLKKHDAVAREKSKDGQNVYFYNDREYKLAQSEYYKSGQDWSKTRELIDTFGLADENEIDIDSCRELINPNFDPYDPTAASQNNCIYCSEAFELRRRGYDVEAQEITSTDNMVTISENDIYVEQDTTDFYYDPYTEAYGCSGTKANCEAMEKQLLSYGEGSRGMLTYYYGGTPYIDYNNLYGHAISWEVKGGKVIFVDCQSKDRPTSNSIYDITMAQWQYVYEVDCIRLDDKQVGDITDHVKKRGTGYE